MVAIHIRTVRNVMFWIHGRTFGTKLLAIYGRTLSFKMFQNQGNTFRTEIVALYVRTFRTQMFGINEEMSGLRFLNP